MNTTKNYLGIKKLILVLVVINSTILISCQEENLPLKYRLTFTNNYYEKINIEIDTFKISNLPPKKKSKSFSIDEGNYNICCITRSNLLIKNELILRGNKKEINISLNRKGRIVFLNN